MIVDSRTWFICVLHILQLKVIQDHERGREDGFQSTRSIKRQHCLWCSKFGHFSGNLLGRLLSSVVIKHHVVKVTIMRVTSVNNRQNAAYPRRSFISKRPSNGPTARAALVECGGNVVCDLRRDLMWSVSTNWLQRLIMYIHTQNLVPSVP